MEVLKVSAKSNPNSVAGALAGVIREMNIGIGAIQSHAELLSVYKEDAREKRQAAAMTAASNSRVSVPTST